METIYKIENKPLYKKQFTNLHELTQTQEKYMFLLDNNSKFISIFM